MLRIAAGGAVDARGSLIGGDITVGGTTVDLALVDGRNLDLTAIDRLTVAQARSISNIAFRAGGGGSFTATAGVLSFRK